MAKIDFRWSWTTDQAHAFLRFLQTEVWTVPTRSPALAGTPEAKVLEPVTTA